MGDKKKKSLKWAGGLGAIVSAITPLTVMVVKEQREISKDETIIDSLNTKILQQANHTHQITDDVRKTLTSIYKDIGEVNKDVGEIKGQITGLEHALNYLIRSNHGN